jgi:hypothetical protein
LATRFVCKGPPGGRTEILNVCRIRRINCDPVESDKESASESFSNFDDWLNCNGDLDNQYDSKEDGAADDDSDIEHNNCIEDQECPEQQDVSVTPNVPGLVRQTLKFKGQAEMVLQMANAVETRRNKEGKKK